MSRPHILRINIPHISQPVAATNAHVCTDGIFHISVTFTNKHRPGTTFSLTRHIQSPYSADRKYTVPCPKGSTHQRI